MLIASSQIIQANSFAIDFSQTLCKMNDENKTEPQKKIIELYKNKNVKEFSIEF